MSATFDPRECAIATDELADRVIAVTGASDGIGRAVAIECARHGASVILVGRSERKLSGVLAEIEALPEDRRDSTIAVLDLEHALAQDYDRLSDAVLERFGRLDGLVHNAALLGTLSPIEHYDVPTWCRVLHVNLTAAFALTQVLLPALKRSSDASVLFTSSGVGRRGKAYWGAYAVSKFGVEGLAQVLAAELSDITAVRVNVINPGATRTRMRAQAYPAENPAGLPEPAAVTHAYLALLGPAGRGVTGASFDAQPAVPPRAASAAPPR